ncbi:hypothetical protein Pelo_19195 [Pelomyxa schiedti]|nr:hypothetical protein Pelo_19195 [Pelomyxa schiedti]
MQKIVVSATIDPVVDARSQFVAFACASIERCARSSPAARSLADGNPALLAEFGRQWVAGCARQVGATLAVKRGDPAGESEDLWIYSTRVAVIMGLSATLGVVWCKCWTCTTPIIGGNWVVEMPLGADGMFLMKGKYNKRTGCVIDVGSCGCGGNWSANPRLDSAVSLPRVVELKRRDPPSWIYISGGFWVRNNKWLVLVEHEHMLTVWRMDVERALPVGDGLCLNSEVTIKCFGSMFSPFNPSGDELVFSDGNEHYFSDPCLYFVDLVKSIEAGVVVITNSLRLPEDWVFDFIWAAPDTILTMNRADSGAGVYNTKTREKTLFPNANWMHSISPGHFAVLHQDSAGDKFAKVYMASDVSHPTHQYLWHSEWSARK